MTALNYPTPLFTQGVIALSRSKCKRLFGVLIVWVIKIAVRNIISGDEEAQGPLTVGLSWDFGHAWVKQWRISHCTGGKPHLLISFHVDTTVDTSIANSTAHQHSHKGTKTALLKSSCVTSVSLVLLFYIRSTPPLFPPVMWHPKSQSGPCALFSTNEMQKTGYCVIYIFTTHILKTLKI